MKIVFTANGRCASAAVEPSGQPITAGSRGVPAEIHLSPEYDGLVVTAFFRSEYGAWPVVLGETPGTVTIPWEAMEKKSLTFDVGVVGKNGDGTIVIPTIWARAGKIVPATEDSGLEPGDPSADIGAQIVEQARAAAKKAEDAAEAAEEARDKMPRIVDGTWRVYNAVTESWEDTGVQAEGQDGVGISDAILNADYTLTLTFSDGTSYTTPPIRGRQGEPGPIGPTPDITIGTVTTGAAGSQAEATMTGTPERPVLNLTIPRGDPGEVTQAEFDDLADEVAQQKSALDHYTKVSLLDYECEYGQWNPSGVKGSSVANRARAASGIYLKKGDLISVDFNEMRLSVVFCDIDALNLSDSGTITSVGFSAPYNGYARINFWKRNGSDITEAEFESLRNKVVIYTNYHERTGENKIDDLKKIVIANQNGYTFFDNSLFEYGGLTNGVINKGLTRRVATPNIITLDYPVTLKAKDGYRFGVQLFSNDIFVSDTGWSTEYSIAANQQFKLVIAKVTENTIAVGVEPILVSKVMVTTQIANASGLVPYSYKGNGDFVKTKQLLYNVKRLGNVIANVKTGVSFQDFAVCNDVLFQLYSNQTIDLIDWETGEITGDLAITSGHGDAISFSNEYYENGDEFPLAYVTSDSNPAEVFVVRITRSATTLIRTLKFPIEQTGYYAGASIDALNDNLYTVGYTENSPSNNASGNNYLIVAEWDLKSMTDNGDDTYTPVLKKKFKLPFYTTIQGQSFFDGKIVCISSASTSPSTKVIFIDVGAERISTVLSDFPTTIKDAEGEGIDFVLSGNKYMMVIHPNNKYYYGIDFNA